MTASETVARPLGLWSAAIFITAVIMALLAMEGLMEYRSAQMRIGILVDDASGELLIESADPGLPAAKAGVEAGDRIVGLNGQPVSGIRAYDRVISDHEPGRPIQLTVSRDGEMRQFEITPGASFPWARYFSLLGPVLAYLGLGLLCLFHWRQDLRARLLAILVLAIAAELAMPIYAIGYPTATAIGETAFFLLTGIQISVELHLVSLIPGRAPWVLRWPSLVRWFYAIGLGLGAVLAGAVLMDFTTPDRHIPWPTDVGYQVVRWVLPAWALTIGGMLAYQMIHYPSPRGRQQAGLVLVGVAPWIIFTTVETVAAFQGTLFGETWYNFTNWTLITFPVAVFIAIFRYHLFDLELVVRRSLVYGSITALLVGMFYAVLAAAWPMASRWLSPTGAAWVVTGLALALGMVATRLRSTIEHAIEVRVFPERHALRRHLIRLAATLPVRGKLPLMGSHLADEACLAFRASSSAIIMIDPQSQLPYTLASSRTAPGKSDGLAALFRTNPRLEQLLTDLDRPLLTGRLHREEQLADELKAQGVEVVAPLVSQNTLIGAICLGAKQSGNAYPGEELELLNLLSHHVVAAFENARLAEHATYEGLTGLYRREVILDILERECARAVQCDEPIAVAMIDIDQFKAFNDDHGHLAGDLVLRRVADTLQAELRSTDMIGRYGGEEFLAVLPNTNLEGARKAAEHLRCGIEALRVPLDNGVVATVNVSVGLAATHEASRHPVQLARSMIETADQYLYEAKQTGRNRVIAGQYTSGAA